MNLKRIAVSTTFAQLLQTAKNLAEELGLPFEIDPAADKYDYTLILTPNFLGLQSLENPKIKPFYIDFLSGRMLYRTQQAGLKKELIAKAMGFKPGEHPLIVDATAGLGRDSFILASLGFDVTLLERSPILFVLLKDAILRASKNMATAKIVSRMHLIHADAKNWLKDIKQQPNVVYLDPMFPERKKAASVKKEMVILQDLLGNDEDSADLFTIALTCSKNRIVVKRPRLAANILERAPNFTLTGKSSRFDIYLV